jgi:oligopeptide transport system substrate-binding protein
MNLEKGETSMRRKHLLSLAVAVVALGLVVAGCGGGSDEGGGSAASAQTITVNWGTEPPSLDPGLATDTTSSNILLNIMDPLVKLDANLNPVPYLAKGWQLSNGGRTVTITLRDDGKWTDGKPVTAEDFRWSWLRTISPELAADYAYQFFGIKGAQEYNACKSNCDALREQVGIQAPDDHTLRIELTSPQPWFLQQMAHHSFLAVPRQTVEKYGAKWTEPQNIVTDGPFKLAKWQHNAEIDLTKWNGWRNADDVSLTRVDGRMITDGTTAVQSFEAGELDANGSIPPEEIPRLKGTDAYNQYPALGTYYYGFNVKNIPDVNQRRAMALAIDRRAIIDNIAQADQIPTTGYTPKGMPGFQTINPSSPWLPAAGNMARAKQLMARVQNPKKNITIYYNDDPAHKPIAIAIQSQWRQLGINATIKAQEWAQFLEFLGPPPNNSVDAYRLGWIGDYVDAMNFLEQWTCDSGNNNTNYCDRSYDALVAKARQTEDDQARYQIYHQLEEKLFGPNGAVPFAPIYWYTYVWQENPSIKDSFNVNLLDQIDLTEVEVQ